MKKISTVLAVIVVLFFGNLSNIVKAEYDNNVVFPDFEDGSEIYGIETGPSQGVVFFPDNCPFIEKITLVSKTSIKGKLIIKKVDSKDERLTKLENVYDSCSIKLENIDRKDIKSLIADLKVRKSWINENNIDKNAISLFTYNNSKWDSQSLRSNDETIVFYTYQTELKQGEIYSIAKSEKSGNWFDIIFQNIPLLLICGLLALLLLIIAFIRNRKKKDQNNQ